MQNKEKDWFGYKKVKPAEKTKLVEGVFDNVASRYDVMNDFMSGGIHRLWKNRLVRLMHPRSSRKLLDVAGGTGDIAFRYRKDAGEDAQITVCDINKEMLKVGRDRAIDRGFLKGFEWVEGNAESLPFADREFHLYSIAFGLRNVTHIDNALAEAYRVLKAGGQFFCLEFSYVNNAALRKIYDEYSFRVIPKLGELVAKDRDSYQYLVESIRQFPKQEELKSRMEKAGFERVSIINLSGGIAAIHVGNKL
ncbi:MAG TPA: bifunctional demethylmenaquinone methyltransferase/2-methoxy-6-polyprenyl-1,4-benzoquinol methylase UbiE [Patescibacteria group bacterium]|nr:bifunctional demethylmenaquinone methyltransferase/2-methoxy-6-polyprenyl-1,4-benzoquinol methylase UbiE [Patescibacteria group bacterium]